MKKTTLALALLLSLSYNLVANPIEPNQSQLTSAVKRLQFDEINNYMLQKHKTQALSVTGIENSEDLIVLGANSKYYLLEIENDIVIISSEMPM
ncbi:MAG: hypothetical protein L6Q81_16240 [Bacteroidia bacterium]|nr:hypothetical protein [Bacteroidia bacterium]